MIVQSMPFPAVVGGGGSTVPTQLAVGGLAASATNVISPGYPSGVQAGRYAILHVHHFSATAGAATFTTPSGWSLINEVTTGDWRAAAYIRKLDGTEAGSLTLTASKSASGSGIYLAIISLWDGINATTPVGASATAATGYNAVWTGSSITTTVNNACVVNLFAGWPLRTSAVGAGWTELYQLNTTTAGDGWMALTYRDQATAGLVAAEARGAESGSSAWASITFELRPV